MTVLTMTVCRDHVAQVVIRNIWVEVLLLDLVAALTVVLMATGLEIAKLEIGRTSAIAVEKEAI